MRLAPTSRWSGNVGATGAMVDGYLRVRARGDATSWRNHAVAPVAPVAPSATPYQTWREPLGDAQISAAHALNNLSRTHQPQQHYHPLAALFNLAPPRGRSARKTAAPITGDAVTREGKERRSYASGVGRDHPEPVATPSG